MLIYSDLYIDRFVSRILNFLAFISVFSETFPPRLFSCMFNRIEIDLDFICNIKQMQIAFLGFLTSKINKYDVRFYEFIS